MSKMLVDTSVVVDLLRNRIRREALPIPMADWYISSVCAGELFYGAAKAHNPKHNLERLTEFLNTVEILPVTRKTAKIYGSARAALAFSGELIPDNDLWIAASALEHDMPLLSSDKHFQRVPDLTNISIQ